MLLYDAFNMRPSQRECISIVGAGGKTTVMQELSKELKQLGKRVVMTTTTKIFMPEKKHYDDCIISMSDDDLLNFAEGIIRPGIYLVGSGIDSEKKLWGVEKEILEKLFIMDNIDCIIVEADGSKRKPIKAPSDQEPVIPGCTTALVGVIGLDSITTPLDEAHAHRPEIINRLCGYPLGAEIDAKLAACLITQEQGLFKGVPTAARKILVLNKADDETLVGQADKIVKLLQETDDLSIISTSFKNNIKNCIIWK